MSGPVSIGFEEARCFSRALFNLQVPDIDQSGFRGLHLVVLVISDVLWGQIICPCSLDISIAVRFRAKESDGVAGSV